MKFIQVVISLVCFVFLFCSVLVFLVDDHSPCHGWLVSCAKKKVCQLISVHFVEEREHCDRRVIRGGGEVKKKPHTHINRTFNSFFLDVSLEACSKCLTAPV